MSATSQPSSGVRHLDLPDLPDEPAQIERVEKEALPPSEEDRRLRLDVLRFTADKFETDTDETLDEAKKFYAWITRTESGKGEGEE